MAGPSVLYQTGNHAGRPAVDAGCVLYFCTTHSKIYVSNATAWSDFVTIPTGASVATDTIWDAAGDLAVGTGADTAAKLAIGATNGMALRRVSGAVAWDLPPGHEFDYVQTTSTTNITATTEGAADTVVTGTATAFDGSTVVWIEAWFPYLQVSSQDTNTIFTLYDGSSSIGLFGVDTTSQVTGFGNSFRWQGVSMRRRLTPAAATKTYSIRAFVSSGTSVVGAGAGGSGNYMPGWVRIVKA